jgi:hypothetical protein
MTENSELDFEIIGRDLFDAALGAHETAPFLRRKTQLEKEGIVLSVVQHALDLVVLRDDSERLTEEQRRAIDRGISIALEGWLREPENPLDENVTA